MKKTACLLILWLVTFAGHSQGDKEMTAIKTVVTKETESFMNVDRKTWSDLWLQAPYAYWSYSDSTGTNYVDGWESINKTFDAYFREQKPSRARITNIWQEVRVYGTGAYVRFVQREEDETGVDETSQVRVLEKREGKWKVVCMNAFAKYPQ